MDTQLFADGVELLGLSLGLQRRFLQHHHEFVYGKRKPRHLAGGSVEGSWVHNDGSDLRTIGRVCRVPFPPRRSPTQVRPTMMARLMPNAMTAHGGSWERSASCTALSSAMRGAINVEQLHKG